MFNENKVYIDLIGGTLSGDDTVIEKLYSDPDKAELIGYYWSGKHHKTIKGINLIAFLLTLLVFAASKRKKSQFRW